ncbi:MAG: hypothetical protein KQH83_12225 [Actinobacteria bacterium]|nr:hypothetical protein [Actinomycetota bacterium]
MRKQTARRAVAALGAAVLLAALSIGIGATAQGVDTYADDFDPAGYAGSDGSLAWSGPWTEVGESDGSSAGVARVKSGVLCASGNCLEIGTFGGSDGVGVRRSADLSGAATATLTYTYRRAMKDGGGAVVVSAAPSASGPWSQVARHSFTASDLVPIPAVVDLSGYAGGTVVVRFAVSGDDVKSRIGIDDLVITVIGVAPTTTTEPPATTTTTTLPPVTTTTLPPVTTTTEASATTTTEASVTTTTEPSVTTATTAPSTATTAAPPGTTTTVAAASATTTTIPGEPEEGAEGPATPAVLPTAGRLGSRPTEGIAMAVAVMPEEEAPVAVRVQPLERLTGAVTTAAANIATPHVAYAMLAVVVAWAGVTGLERDGRRRSVRRRVRRIRRRW